MTRFDIINKLISDNKYTSYLEIGTQQSVAASQIDSIYLYKVGVDPAPVKRVDGDFHDYFNMTSDEFFFQNNRYFDIIFIDGLHTYEQSAKDFINAMKFLNRGGVIVMHDCLPHNKEYSSLLWNGEVYKTVNEIHKHGYDYYIVDTDHGCAVIKYGRGRKDISYTESKEMTYEDFLESREGWEIISPEQFLNESR